MLLTFGLQMYSSKSATEVNRFAPRDFFNRKENSLLQDFPIREEMKQYIFHDLPDSGSCGEQNPGTKSMIASSVLFVRLRGLGSFFIPDPLPFQQVGALPKNAHPFCLVEKQMHDVPF